MDEKVVHKMVCIISGGVFPCTIVTDRYTGSYSGGKFTAWAQYPDDVPQEIFSQDVPCGEFWEDEVKKLVGIGDTPQEAYDDLNRKMKEAGVRELWE